MTTDATEMVSMATAQVLLTPAMATSHVSRQEIVNLIVVEYIDQTKEQIAIDEEAAARLAKTTTDACRDAYGAWYALICSRVLPRLSPWHTAVQAALGTELSNLYSAALPMPSECSYSAHGVTSPEQARHDRDVTRVLDLLQRWLDRSSLTARPSFTEKIGGFSHRAVETVDPAEFLMDWTFATVGAKYAPDWHHLTIKVDVRPDEGVARLLNEMIDAYQAHQRAFQAIHKLKAEIEEKNIGQLERRALAKLTRQTMGEIVRPSLA